MASKSGILSPFRHHSQQEEKIELWGMKKRKVDEEESKLFTNYCDYGKNDLVDQEGEGGGLLAYPENV